MFQPTQLPAIRDELIEGWAGDLGPGWADSMLHLLGNEVSAERRAMTGEQVAAEEQERLNAADLFFVGADMAKLALAAAKSLPEFTLRPQDLPAPYGLILYDEVLETLETINEQNQPDKMFIVGANWGIEAETNTRPAGVWLTWLQHRDLWLEFARHVGRHTPRQSERMRQHLPRVFINHQIRWPFELPGTVDNFAAPDSERPYDVDLENTLKTTWLLMNQPMAVNTDTQLSRNERRRLERKGITPPTVRVITLRRPSSAPADDTDPERQYHHQWIVRGHWRNQWYPSVQDHRPVWIAPHIKGPEDAPFLGGEKVHSWTR
jgi:hypothetical protein